MKHATSETLVALLPLLTEVRRLGPLVERTPGAFYLNSQAFLHFHEDLLAEANEYAAFYLADPDGRRIEVSWHAN